MASKKCPDCNCECNENAQFCPNCGAILYEEKPEILSEESSEEISKTPTKEADLSSGGNVNEVSQPSNKEHENAKSEGLITKAGNKYPLFKFIQYPIASGKTNFVLWVIEIVVTVIAIVSIMQKMDTQYILKVSMYAYNECINTVQTTFLLLAFITIAKIILESNKYRAALGVAKYIDDTKYDYKSRLKFLSNKRVPVFESVNYGKADDLNIEYDILVIAGYMKEKGKSLLLLFGDIFVSILRFIFEYFWAKKIVEELYQNALLGGSFSLLNIVKTPLAIISIALFFVENFWGGHKTEKITEYAYADSQKSSV